jgi:integrase/recombinase XerD
MKGYQGIFSELLKKFVAFKQSLGFKYNNEADELYRFSVFSTKFALTEPKLTKEIVLEWNARRPGEGVKNVQRRAYCLRQFAIYLNSMGVDSYIATPDSNTRHYTFTPYIFSRSEMEKIFAKSDRVYPHKLSNMHLILPVILRMLYCCGLRISEAVNLQNKHVNLKEGILEIKNSKFGKDRMVPMSDSMISICRQYFRNTHKGSSADDYFFCDINGKQIKQDNVYRRFRQVLWECGISHGGKGNGPRLHDLRHTFAVHSLKKAVDQHTDVYCALPILSTYLGHASIEATGQYVRLTADFFPEINAILDKNCAYVIPEVVWE